jgi:hypothetical protein
MRELLVPIGTPRTMLPIRVVTLLVLSAGSGPKKCGV